MGVWKVCTRIWVRFCTQIQVLFPNLYPNSGMYPNSELARTELRTILLQSFGHLAVPGPLQYTGSIVNPFRPHRRPIPVYGTNCSPQEPLWSLYGPWESSQYLELIAVSLPSLGLIANQLYPLRSSGPIAVRSIHCGPIVVSVTHYCAIVVPGIHSIFLYS